MEVATQTIEEGDLIPSKEIPKPKEIPNPLFKVQTTYNRSLRIEKDFKGTIDDALIEAHHLMTNARKDGLDIASVSIGRGWYGSALDELHITIVAESRATVNS